MQTQASPARYARVALPIPVDKTFTYRIPDELTGDVFVGCRVEVPFGRRVLSGVVTEITPDSDVPKTRPIRARVDTYLPPELLDLARWIASYYGCSLGEAVQSVLPPSLRRARVRRRIAGVLRATPGAGGIDAARRDLGRAKRRLALLVRLLEVGGEAPLAAVTGEWGFSRPVVDGLVASGYAAVASGERRSPLDRMDPSVVTLTEEQAGALGAITDCLDEGGFHPVLLHGVTGSGKTEVYLRAAQHVVERGGGCIVLVPEIGLLPQATVRYRRLFGDAVAIIHSRLTGPERFDAWEKIERGEHRVVVGPRSAVFSPVRDLRLVVVDEEQDDSYKQDDKPRYHGRAVALMRGKLEGLTVVLGSATPSAESLHHAREGRYRSLRLAHRVQGVPPPQITLVDMRGGEARGGVFSPQLVERIERALADRRQVIVFLNKRGHARYVQCNACGWVATCRRCDISLTYHRVDHRLKCHFCGYSRPQVSRCDQCGNARLFFSGVGTQRVELEIQALFPGLSVLRMDADTTAGKEGHRRILEEFSTGDYPILLGTQMVAKGHHFPGVGLVGVLGAEEGLNFPDFRSSERTFQQLTQVAGRAGRVGRRGEVVIQTYMPDHHVFRFLERHDYDGFMEEELRVRRELGYPPYARTVLASCSAADPGVLHAVMEEWARTVRALLAGRGTDVLGPTPPLVARVKNRYREQLLLKGALRAADKERVLASFEDLVRGRRRARGVDLRWDVDPESFS